MTLQNRRDLLGLGNVTRIPGPTFSPRPDSRLHVVSHPRSRLPSPRLLRSSRIRGRSFSNRDKSHDQSSTLPLSTSRYTPLGCLISGDTDLGERRRALDGPVTYFWTVCYFGPGSPYTHASIASRLSARSGVNDSWRGFEYPGRRAGPEPLSFRKPGFRLLREKVIREKEGGGGGG